MRKGSDCDYDKHKFHGYILHIYIITVNHVMVATVRRVWRYQRGNQNSYIEEAQTTQWPKEKVQRDKQPSTKPTDKTSKWWLQFYH